MSNLAQILLVGVATWYGPGFYGKTLGCGWCPSKPIRFSQSTVPWVAVDESMYQQEWTCWDHISVWISGVELRLRLLDAGPLYAHYIKDFGPDVPIVADIPEHLWPRSLSQKMSAPVRVVNRSLAKRELERIVEQ